MATRVRTRQTISNILQLSIERAHATMTTPHNFDSQALSHQITAILVEDRAFDADCVTYYPARAKTRAGVRIATRHNTWCHIIDGANDSLVWHVICRVGAGATGLQCVADGTIDTEHIPTHRVATLLEQIINASTYAVSPTRVSSPAPTPRAEAIVLDANTLRDEINDRATAGEIDAITADSMARIDDDALYTALHKAADDNFWRAVDDVYTKAIDAVMREIAADGDA